MCFVQHVSLLVQHLFSGALALLRLLGYNTRKAIEPVAKGGYKEPLVVDTGGRANTIRLRKNSHSAQQHCWCVFSLLVCAINDAIS